MTLKTVAQKLVAIESLSANTASGCINADQNLSNPLLVPKMKIEASGRKTSGNIMKMSMPMLSGRTTSNPRTCRIAGAILLIYFVLVLCDWCFVLGSGQYRNAVASG